MNDMFGPNGLVPRQLQHFRQAISDISRFVNQLHRPPTESAMLEDLEEFPMLRREGFFDGSFFDILFSQGQTRVPTGGLAPEELANLPTTIYHEPTTNKKNQRKEGNEDSRKSCVICLNDFQDGEEIRSLACNHLFHKPCIDSWLTQKGCCPICRRNLTQ